MVNITYLSKVSSRFLVVAGMVAVAALVFSAPSFARADTLNRQLEIGSTGSDVGSLQTFLAQDATLYPEGRVTSYFGSLTSSAVSRFQTRNGISAVGRVGPVTLVALNAQMAGIIASGADISAPIISNLGVTANNSSASVSWTTNEFSRGVVYYSTSPLMVSETLHTVTIIGSTATTDANLNASQRISLSNLQSNTTYYYMVFSADSEGNQSVSWPSTFRTI